MKTPDLAALTVPQLRARAADLGVAGRSRMRKKALIAAITAAQAEKAQVVEVEAVEPETVEAETVEPETVEPETIEVEAVEPATVEAVEPAPAKAPAPAASLLPTHEQLPARYPGAVLRLMPTDGARSFVYWEPDEVEAELPDASWEVTALLRTGTDGAPRAPVHRFRSAFAHSGGFVPAGLDDVTAVHLAPQHPGLTLVATPEPAAEAPAGGPEWVAVRPPSPAPTAVSAPKAAATAPAPQPVPGPVHAASPLPPRAPASRSDWSPRSTGAPPHASGAGRATSPGGPGPA